MIRGAYLRDRAEEDKWVAREWEVEELTGGFFPPICVFNGCGVLVRPNKPATRKQAVFLSCQQLADVGADQRPHPIGASPRGLVVARWGCVHQHGTENRHQGPQEHERGKIQFLLGPDAVVRSRNS